MLACPLWTSIKSNGCQGEEHRNRTDPDPEQRIDEVREKVTSCSFTSSLYKFCISSSVMFAQYGSTDDQNRSDSSALLLETSIVDYQTQHLQQYLTLV